MSPTQFAQPIQIEPPPFAHLSTLRAAGSCPQGSARTTLARFGRSRRQDAARLGKSGLRAIEHPAGRPRYMVNTSARATQSQCSLEDRPGLRHCEHLAIKEERSHLLLDTAVTGCQTTRAFAAPAWDPKSTPSHRSRGRTDGMPKSISVARSAIRLPRWSWPARSRHQSTLSVRNSKRRESRSQIPL